MAILRHFTGPEYGRQCVSWIERCGMFAFVGEVQLALRISNGIGARATR